MQTHLPDGVSWYPVHVIPEDKGYSVIAATLPGCASQGDCFTEALENIKEALIGCIEQYLEDNEPLPLREELPLEKAAYRCIVYIKVPGKRKDKWSRVNESHEWKKLSDIFD